MDEKLRKILHIYFSAIDTLRKEAISNKLQSETLRDDLTQAYDLLHGLDESQKSPWIKIEPGCRLPGDMERIVVMDVCQDKGGSRDFKYCLGVHFKTMESFEIDGRHFVDLDKFYADKSIGHYWMPIPPLPGGEE